MHSRIGSIVIAGGGVAGWTAAARLAREFGHTVSVTVLETPDRTPGEPEAEAAPPELQHAFFQHLGIAEETWMRACSASFNVAVKYVNWRTGAPIGTAEPYTLPNGSPDVFYRTYDTVPEHGGVLLPDHWQWRRNQGVTTEPVDYACFREPPLMDARKSPRWLDGRAAFPYAWHIDTRLFTEYVRRFAVHQLGVRAVRADLTGAARDHQGNVTLLHTSTGEELPGDFFLDCTGQRALLLSGILKEPFVPADEQLLCDSTVTATVPHDDRAHGLDPYTTAVALPTGWAWKTPLPGRFGTGHVHSSAWTEPEEAARGLCDLWNLRPDRVTVHHTRHRTGRARRSWLKNCVALGTASSHLDPLRPTRIAAVLHALDELIRTFPSLDAREAPARRFNARVESRYARELDLLQLHYAATPRTDTPFWKAQHSLPVTAEVADVFTAYRTGQPFTPEEAAHYCTLASLIPTASPSPPSLAHRPDAVRTAEEQFTRIKRQQRILLETLPTAHTYLTRLHNRTEPRA
ncbi:tryptophan 7-halogenase [Streptomyces sp. NPDC050504]|uniref:tryptophan 7-halogenase n=1 Tax=Streptomyces sp. NPDC050504 TaxID=3365618 RepID=UPI00379C301E